MTDPMLGDHDMPTPLLTILTPTYNRRHLLPRLYDSIIRQRVPDGTFEWLVIDDGSTDDTTVYLVELSARHPGRVRFHTQQNGGKHRALNAGAELARGEWVMVVDSDDWLTDEALPTALAAIEEYGLDRRIGTIVTPLYFPALGIRRRFRQTQNPCTMAQCVANEAHFDTCMIRRLDALRGAPFPEVPGEKFMAEGWQHFRVSHNYLIYLLNEYIIEANYLDDGLSANSRKIRRESPSSAIIVYTEMLSHNLPISHKLRYSINRGRFWWHALSRCRSGKGFDNGVPASDIILGLPVYIADFWFYLFSRS